MTTGHTPIGEYHQRFFLNLSFRCPCGKVEVQTTSTSSCSATYISSQQDLATLLSIALSISLQTTHQPSALTTVDHLLRHSPKRADVQSLISRSSLSFFSLLFFLFFPFSLSHSLSYLSRSFVSTTACLRALCNKLLI